jgi:hypothetical protein
MCLKMKLAVGAAAMSITALGGALAAAPASAVGPGLFVLPQGAVATFTNATFGACNNLTWGTQLNPPLGAQNDQLTFPGGCTSATAPDVTIGPFDDDVTLRAYLRDNTCSVTYFSDGTSDPGPVDHVIVTPTGPDAFQLRFADGGGFCERAQIPATTFTGFNFEVNLTITTPEDDQGQDQGPQ